MSRRDNHPPSVSVIIPTYNAGPFIFEAIQSVLDQTFRFYEIIVVDDGSTDDTKNILKRFDSQIHYLFQENQGPSAARNAGIKMSRGTYISFLDADDIWMNDKLQLQLEFLESHSGIALVFSDHQNFKEGREIQSKTFLDEKKERFGEDFLSEIPLKDAFLKMVQENFISTPTVILKRECFEKIGLFDENLRSVEDRDLWIRIAASYPLACFPKVLCKRRIHQTNITSESELTLYARIKVLEKNRSDFPFLIPSEIWDSELAIHYSHLGYKFLQNDLRWKAMQSGLAGLKHAFRQLTKNRELTLQSWKRLIGLIPASILGWRFSRFLFRPIKDLILE